MNFIHCGIPSTSEEKADRFYVNILGLEKSVPKILEKRLSLDIFGINDDMLLINYKRDNIHFELIISQEYRPAEKQIAHSCIQVKDLKEIVDKCLKAGLKVIQVPKGSAVVTFIADYDGNLFEMKEQDKIL